MLKSVWHVMYCAYVSSACLVPLHVGWLMCIELCPSLCYMEHARRQSGSGEGQSMHLIWWKGWWWMAMIIVEEWVTLMKICETNLLLWIENHHRQHLYFSVLHADLKWESCVIKDMIDKKIDIHYVVHLIHKHLYCGLYAVVLISIILYDLYLYEKHFWVKFVFILKTTYIAPTQCLGSAIDPALKCQVSTLRVPQNVWWNFPVGNGI